MALTYTASAAQSTATPRVSNASVTRVQVNYTNQNASLSVGDVIQMLKLPDGVIVTGWQINYKLFDDTQGLFNIIVQSAAGNVNISATLTGSSTATFQYDSEAALGVSAGPGGLNLPYTNSLSDDHMPQYSYVSLLIGAGTTTTQSIIVNLTVDYIRGRSGDH